MAYENTSASGTAIQPAIEQVLAVPAAIIAPALAVVVEVIEKIINDLPTPE